MVDKHPVQVKVEQILEKNVTYVEFSLINDDFINVYKPNQENSRNNINFSDTGINIVENSEDGCTYDTYISFDNIVLTRGIYNCPEIIENEEGGEPESEEDVESN